MFSSVLSATLQGLSVTFVHVEADVSNGLPMFQLVGYLSSEVKEAGERVKSAIRNTGFLLPPKKIVVNLSPANLRKRGSVFDLAIAVAVLAANGELPSEKISDTVFVGELSLDGRVKKIAGVLPVVMAAQKQGYRRCIIPKENQREGELVDGVEIVGVSSLEELCQFLKYDKVVERKPLAVSLETEETGLDFAEIRGQHLVKRAVEIAVAGNHNILMIGPPGAGKTAIAKRIPGILPTLTYQESLELTIIYSVLGQIDENNPLKNMRPFREVHQSITRTALLGGGVYPKPGEITLANKGVLFLDEIAEFSKPLLETLRQPMEEHYINIVRERGNCKFPAEFLLVAAMNPCPCGNYPDLNLCTCTGSQIQGYLGKLSQPFLDRIDLCVEVPKVQYKDLANTEKEETSENIRERIVKVRQLQKERYKECGILTNAHMDIKQIEKFCVLNEGGKQVMEQAYEKLGLTARTYHKVLSVARTIADLDGQDEIRERHLREALSFRMMDMKYRRSQR